MSRWLGAAMVLWRSGVSALWLSACSSGDFSVSGPEARCRRLCEESKRCFSADPPRPFDCFTSCDDLEAVNRANDCYDEVDAYYGCIERYGVCADPTTECAEQEDVYSDCLTDSCSTDPDRDICL